MKPVLDPQQFEDAGTKSYNFIQSAETACLYMEEGSEKTRAQAQLVELKKKHEAFMETIGMIVD